MKGLFCLCGNSILKRRWIYAGSLGAIWIPCIAFVISKRVKSYKSFLIKISRCPGHINWDATFSQKLPAIFRIIVAALFVLTKCVDTHGPIWKCLISGIAITYLKSMKKRNVWLSGKHRACCWHWEETLYRTSITNRHVFVTNYILTLWEIRVKGALSPLGLSPNSYVRKGWNMSTTRTNVRPVSYYPVSHQIPPFQHKGTHHEIQWHTCIGCSLNKAEWRIYVYGSVI